jgi:hypothetical protein
MASRTRLWLAALLLVLTLSLLPVGVFYIAAALGWKVQRVEFSRASFLTEYYKALGTLASAITGFFIADTLIRLRDAEEIQRQWGRVKHVPMEIVALLRSADQAVSNRDQVRWSSLRTELAIAMSRLRSGLDMGLGHASRSSLSALIEELLLLEQDYSVLQGPDGWPQMIVLHRMLTTAERLGGMLKGGLVERVK